MDMISRTSTAVQEQAIAAAEVRALSLLIGRLQRGLRRRVRAAMPLPPLPQSQIEVLRLLHEQPGLRVQQVAAALRLAPNTTSTLVQQLMRQGYIVRHVDAADRRSASLELTPTARERLAAWRDTRVAVLGQTLEGLSPGERERLVVALPSLTRLADLLEDLNE
jgi:DNA-binding MarR family transcriptional regulator